MTPRAVFAFELFIPGERVHSAASRAREGRITVRLKNWASWFSIAAARPANVAQLVEHPHGKGEVAGSIPAIGSDLIKDPNIAAAPETAREASKAKDALENFLGLGLVIVSIIVAVKYFGGDQLRAWVEGAGAWGPLALIVAKATTIIAAPLSGGPLYPVAGALFGTGPAILYLFLGDALGGAVSFFIARRFGRALVERILAKSNEGFLDKALGLMGTVRGFLVARVCFIALPEAVAYGAGLTRLPFLPFIAIYSSIGLVPAAVLAWLGDAAVGSGSHWLVGLGLLGGGVAAAAGAALFMKLAGKKLGLEASPDAPSPEAPANPDGR